MAHGPAERSALSVIRNEALRAEAGPRIDPLPRDTALFPGASTRSVLARVLVGQLEEGLTREDADGVRRSCALLEAIWRDVPAAVREKALGLTRKVPEGSEGLVRLGIRDGDAALAADAPTLPCLVLQDLGLVDPAVVRAICARGDFETAILPRLAAQPENARVAVAQHYPEPMPDAVRDALVGTLRQGDTALGDALSGRADRFTADLADDLSTLPATARLERLRLAAKQLERRENPPPSPLIDKITERLTALAEAGHPDTALALVAHLMRVPAALVDELARDEDPVRLALAMRGVCLGPSLADAMRGSSDWASHPARALVEGEPGYTIGRRFVADLRAKVRSTGDPGQPAS